jgi:single-strand DNA-binding protein
MVTEGGRGKEVAMANNEVHLVGRVSGAPEPKELPSGDRLVALRVVVPRSLPRRAPTRKAPVVDTIDVTCWTSITRRVAERLGPGDVVEVTGALRRRFFRGGGGVQSRYDVEVSALRRMTDLAG